MKKSTFSIILVFTFVITSLTAQLTPEEAVLGMGRGINLGNTLEPPTESAWNNGPAQESYFDAYIDAGFTNVRVPVRWDLHTENAAPFAIDETWMNRVEQVIDWGLSRGLYITLNGHHEDWLKNNYSNQTLRDRYDAIWVQVAERFKDKSDRLLFEIINEPNGMTVAQVDDLNQRILDIIRISNPTRIVIYGGNMYANSEQLLNAVIPEDDYLIGYYHAYDPWQFSGQGQGTWGSANDYQQVTNKYQSVKNWSNTFNVPIHHSEFGAVLIADFNSRMRIYAHNTEQCILKGFAFSVWDDGGDFRVLNRSDNSWPEVKDILVHYHEDSPNQIFSSFSLDPQTDAPTIVVDWNNRSVSNSSIILERSVGASSDYVEIAELSSDATTFTDLDVETGNTYTYRMYTTREDGTLLHGYPTRYRINATQQSPYNGSYISIPGVLEVEEYDEGGEGLAYHDSEPANQSGNFRPGEGVDIGSFNGGHILGYVASGEWIEYTVDVNQAGTYSVSAELASEIANGTFSITSDKNNSSVSFTSPNTGGWVNFQTIQSQGELELEKGIQQLTLRITNSNAFNVDNLTFELKSVSTNEPNKLYNQIRVFPNPSFDIVNIDINELLIDDNAQLEIFNSKGEKLAAYKLLEGKTSLDISTYPSGVYFIEFSNSDSHYVQKIVKERR